MAAPKKETPAFDSGGYLAITGEGGSQQKQSIIPQEPSRAKIYWPYADD